MVKVGEISPPTFRISAMQVWRKLAGLHFVEEINHESHCSRLLFSTICLAYTSAFAQGDFSADVVNGRNPDHKTKIYVTKTKMRLEDSSKGGMMGGIIINTETQVWDILMPARHMYMETSDADRMQCRTTCSSSSVLPMRRMDALIGRS
jgi:hypothetical protein